MNKQEADKKREKRELLGPQYFCPHIRDICRKDCKYIVKPLVEGKFLEVAGGQFYSWARHSKTDFVVLPWDCSWDK